MDKKLGLHSKDFMDRVWATPSDVYQKRLKAIGFQDKKRVLDAGCGYGQWTAALSVLNSEVHGLEADSEILQEASSKCEKEGYKNIQFSHGSIEKTSYSSESFDAVFSYSVLYFTDFKKSISEAYRLLQKDGLFYINTNDIGWYLHCIVNEPNKSADFSPRSVGTEAIANTISYYAAGQRTIGTPVIMPYQYTLDLLKETGFDILSSGPDGSINLNEVEGIQPFFGSHFENHRSVYEVLAKKI